MSACFIISFDCEGKWGMADKLTEWHDRYLTNQHLFSVYERLLALLDKYEISATFAFVGAFALSIDEYYTSRDRFRAPSINGQSWLEQFNRDAKRENFSGWFAPDCYQLVKQKAAHEIASHGFTHVPLTQALITEADFFYEMSLIKELAPYGRDKDLTFIYPRNQIGYTDALKTCGFIGYRDDRSTLAHGNALSRLASELNIFYPKADSHPATEDMPIKIPAGQFLNWRHGVRGFVPACITELRWQRMLDDAISNHKTLHLWTHPHNFITGKDMFPLFEQILKTVSAEHKHGRIQILTQKEYCYQSLTLSVPTPFITRNSHPPSF